MCFRQWRLAMFLIAVSMCGMARADELPRLATDFGKCPRQTEEFLRYIVQRRAAEGLNGVALKDPRFDPPTEPGKSGAIAPHKGSGEDLNIVWTAAAAYRYPWSRFYHNPDLRKRAFLLMDRIVRSRADGLWDDGGLDGFFGVQSLSWAALEWIETGDVDQARADMWRSAAIKAAEQGLICLHYGPYRPSGLTGEYANPEMYLLSGLAATWKLTGQQRYRDEAAKALHRYDHYLFDGGGLPYFLQSAPQHGYQQMAVKSVCLYFDLTGDPYALEFLKRLAPYYPNVQHRSGLMTDAEMPQLKHYLWNFVNPAVPAMLAAELQDGANRYSADAATPLTADNVDKLLPSFPMPGAGWYNFNGCTFAAAALRVLAHHPLPKAIEPLPRRLFVDHSFAGVRSHWDDFTAAVGTRQMNDSLAGAYLADVKQPMFPLAGAVDGVYFEVCQGKQTVDPTGKHPWKSEFRCVEWSPAVQYCTAPGFASVGCLTRLCVPYWGDMPPETGDEHSAKGVCDWVSLQHWAVWRDHLIGLGTLRCDADGGAPEGGDVARIRWRLAPAGLKLVVQGQSESACQFQYGGLNVDLQRLDQRGGFAFSLQDIGKLPQATQTPVLSRSAPWSHRDFVHVATLIRPAGAEASVSFKSMNNAAAAVLLDPGARKATVWVVNLERHFQQILLDVPGGMTVTAYKHGDELPAVPTGEPANLGLLGAESAVWIVDSPTAINVKQLLDGMHAGKTR